MRTAFAFAFAALAIPIALFFLPSLISNIIEDPLSALYIAAGSCLAAVVLIVKIKYIDPHIHEYLGHHPFEDELGWNTRTQPGEDAKRGKKRKGGRGGKGKKGKKKNQ